MIVALAILGIVACVGGLAIIAVINRVAPDIDMPPVRVVKP